MPEKLRIDFESYSEADLKKVGPWAYSKHPSTEVLILAWAFDDDPPAVWLPGDPPPPWVTDLTLSAPPFQVTAWNDFFELCLMAHVLKWYIPPPKYWADTAAKAAALALPRSLEDCGAVIGLTDAQKKSDEGAKLIRFFSMPRKSTKKESYGALIRNYPKDYPEQFKQFISYCKQDVIAERAIDKALPDLQPRTRKLWELDRKINLRGLHFDMPAVKSALKLIKKGKTAIINEVSDRTLGMLDNIRSRDQFLEYMDMIKTPLQNAQKEYLKRTLAELERTPSKELAADILRLRLDISLSSLAKYEKMAAVVDISNDRAYGLLRFHGASTGRWSGNLIQPQNFPRESLDRPDACIDLFNLEDPEAIEMIFGPVLRAVSLCLRGMITASPGNRLIVSDFSQIESRVLAWLAGDVKKLEAYENGRDIYKINAAAAYKVSYDEVTKEQRQIGKVIELACGYGGALGAFKQFAEVYGVVIPDDEATRLIKNWRLANPKITSYWSTLEALAVGAVRSPGSLQRTKNVGYKVAGQFLFCILPSGRYIAYHKPRLVASRFDKEQIQYWGVDSVTRKYVIQRTYGGKLAENVTQAVAMDCMADKTLEIDPNYPLVLTVHDELVSDVTKGVGSIEDFNEKMETVPPWAKGLPIAAEGYEAHRYRK